MFHKRIWTTACIFAAALLLGLPFISFNDTASANGSSSGFETLAKDLTRMNALFKVGADRTVFFDSAAATKQRFSKESITLAQEITAFTNDLTTEALRSQVARGENSETINLEGIKMNVARYPSLATFMDVASRRVKNGYTSVALPNSAQQTCGSIGNPVPSRAAKWQTWGPYNSKQDAENQLKKWGYYRAWWVPHGNWTRDQTYQESICKKNTYRDEASLPFNSNRKWYFNEQNYTGTIPGEPNPVLTAATSGWPYATWPAYVWWWHCVYTSC